MIVNVNITDRPQDQAAGISETVSFTCVATGNRAPNITWIRQQDGVMFTGTFNSSGNTNVSVLEISNVTSVDIADYSCVAENTVSDNIIENMVAQDIADFTLYEAGKFVSIYVI